GVVPLAILDFYRNLGRGEAEILSIEKYEENIEAYQYLVPAYAERVPGMQIEKPMQADLMNLPLEETPSCIDLLVFSNVLNEIQIPAEKRADLVLRFSRNLSPDGTIVVIEPADLVNATEMRRTVSVLLDRGLSMFSPCTFIWGTRCHSPTCWSFEEKGDIKPTRLMEAISASASEPYQYINTDIKFSYALLRKDRRTREVYRAPPQAKFARLSRLSSHVKRRINVVAAVMSADLGDARNHVYKICDGTAKEPVYAILPRHHESEKNIALRESAYGGVIEIFNVLVRYNREHDAYNLLVDKYTRICPAHPQRQPDTT
ncbi:MAG TPA: hypothetical protein VE134_02605, partial [Methanomicrobiales archaeon]|nr:hypothetical protein [Methanomicrobiales archaeon]